MAKIGGAWLDLGVYCVGLLSEISEKLELDMMEFKEKSIVMKKREGVEYWVDVDLQYQFKKKTVDVNITTKINPGVQFCNEIRVEFDDGSALTQMEYTHPGNSLGIFLETNQG